MNKIGINEITVKGKRVFMRVDFNVPMDDQQNITDDTRIRAALPTVKYLVQNGAKVILASHLGRPKGKVDPQYSLSSVVSHLSKLLGQDVLFASDCIGSEVKRMTEKLSDGEILLLENLRYHAEEEKNDPDFARSLADLAEIYVNDAFGAAHRAHASTEGIAKYIPAYAGFLMKKELDILGQALSDPARPFVAIIGGAKVSDKIGVIENLLKKVDALIIGGGMANTFLKAKGFEVGESLIEPDKIDLAKQLLCQAESNGVKLMLPTDVVVTREFKADASFRITDVAGIKEDEMALDIGPVSANTFAEAILAAQTVIWNGPMGVFEMDNFARGTEQIAQSMAKCTGTTIIGGGDSVAAVEKVGVAEKMTHISTGGGASLEFLEGKTLPGIAILKDKNE